jgi:macrolide transport system ATP-binding/permease protein
MFEDFRQGFNTLAANKIRTALSMLGILIGVAAVVAMLALGSGAQKSIEAQLASLGSNLLVLRPGAVRIGGVSQEAGTVTRLTPEDARTIQQEIPGIRDAAPTVSGRAQVAYLDKNWSTQVIGASPAYARMHSAVPGIGRFFTEEENRKRARVAVIGMTLVKELFGDHDPMGEMIKINRVSFQVIGILPEKGATGFRDQDDAVIVPVLTAMHRLLGKDYVDYIDIEVSPTANIDATQDRVVDLMLSRHRVPEARAEDAFRVRNMADIQEAVAQSSRTFTVLLASIAAISLLVGGIGIMNIMLVSVTERTKEIGLRKAIGARRKDILQQFLIESVVVSIVGGLSGIALGWIITLLLSALAGWATSISLQAVLLAFFFSAGIGVVFGIYPAKKASALHPIDALRYE